MKLEREACESNVSLDGDRFLSLKLKIEYAHSHAIYTSIAPTRCQKTVVKLFHENCSKYLAESLAMIDSRIRVSEEEKITFPQMSLARI